MGCGGSKDKLHGAEKPLDHWMEKTELENVDKLFEKAENIISAIENKRKSVVDDLDDVYGKVGAIAFKKKDLSKALKCVLWKLGVDNGGISEIGFNLEGPVFEGKKNSQEGNDAGNFLIKYCKNVTEEWKMEEFTNLFKEIEELNSELVNNAGIYVNDIKEKFKSDFVKAIKKSVAIKGNISRCSAAVVAIKDILERFKILVESAASVISGFNPTEWVKEADNVEKAKKMKITNIVEIAWNLIPNPLEKNGKKYEECQKEYGEKCKVRNEIFAKYAQHKQ